MKRRINLRNERAEMELPGELAGIEIPDGRGLDFARIDLCVVERFATGFLDHVAQGFAFFFEIALKVGSARAENVNWFVHGGAKLSHGWHAVIRTAQSGSPTF